MKERASAIGGLEKLVGALDSFRCCKDNDIEIFLRSKAFRFLDCGWCSIYLIVDEQKFDAGTICVEGYFTLSHKSLISDGISKSKVKKVTGGFKEASSMHFVLIGQLGKHIEYTEDGEKKASKITSREILDYAFEVIKASSALIPCRVVLVECSDNPNVQKVYTDYEFEYFQFDGEHHQFIKKLE